MDISKIHLALVQNKAKIEKPIRVVEIFLFASIFVFLIYYLIKGNESPRLRSLGNILGDISFLLYCLSLLPGIIGRFKVFQKFRSIMILFRRHIGVSAFLLGILHQGFVFTFPVLASRMNFFELLGVHEVYGFIILILFFPLWLTANDFSVMKLGRHWKTIHSLTYVAVLFVFVHIATSSSVVFTIVAFMVLILEAFSWIYTLISKVQEKSAPQSQGPQ